MLGMLCGLLATTLCTFLGVYDELGAAFLLFVTMEVGLATAFRELLPNMEKQSEKKSARTREIAVTGEETKVDSDFLDKFLKTNGLEQFGKLH